MSAPSAWHIGRLIDVRITIAGRSLVTCVSPGQYSAWWRLDNGQVVVGQHVAEKLGIPAVLALPIPMSVATREFPWAGIAIPRWWPSALNRATFLGVKGPAMMFGRTVDRWRDVDLP